MKQLDHIESPKTQYEGYKYFATITLPSRLNRLNITKQKAFMDKALLRLGTSYLESFIGAYEFTKKGNIHAHIVVKPSEYFYDVPFVNQEARERAELIRLSSYFKQLSICDVQLIKKIENVYAYIQKDIIVSGAAINSSPHLRFNKYHNNDIIIQPLAIDTSILDVVDTDICNNVKCNIKCKF